MASFLYTNATKHIGNGGIDFDTHTIKISLHSSSYTPNQDTHEFYDDVDNEITGTGYSAGGATLASKTITVDTSNNRTVYDCADPSWAGASFTARYAVVYRDTGTASTSPLIALIDFGGNVTVSAQTFEIPLSSTLGLFYISTT